MITAIVITSVIVYLLVGQGVYSTGAGYDKGFGLWIACIFIWPLWLLIQGIIDTLERLID